MQSSLKAIKLAYIDIVSKIPKQANLWGIILIRDLTNYGQKKPKNNIQDVGSSIKCRYIMCTTTIYWQTTDI